MRCWQRLLLAVGLVLAAGPVLAASEVRNVRVHQAPDHTRVVFDISAPVQFNLFTLDNPDRVVLDLADARYGAELAANALQETPVTGLRVGKRGNGVRVVLDLQRTLQPNAFDLRPVGPHGHRLVLDLHNPAPVLTAPAPATPTTPAGQRSPDVVVAIDAGHGGEDPGALGPDGIQEKDVVLALARELKAQIDRLSGYRAELVRTGDYYIGRRERATKGRELKADMFVSIHADAFKSPRARGASVYTLSNQGATNEHAKWLSQRAERSDLIGAAKPVAIAEQPEHVAKVLLDLVMDGTRKHSDDLAQAVLQEMGAVTRLHSDVVHQAYFTVLTAPDVPSILVESGYITNPREARKLATPEYRRVLATAIAAGIQAYTASNPPAGTLVAKRAAEGDRQYTIRRGDTLSGIAERFRVSQTRLRQHNGLRNAAIRAGQVLRIPAS